MDFHNSVHLIFCLLSSEIPLPLISGLLKLWFVEQAAYHAKIYSCLEKAEVLYPKLGFVLPDVDQFRLT